MLTPNNFWSNSWSFFIRQTQSRVSKSKTLGRVNLRL